MKIKIDPLKMDYLEIGAKISDKQLVIIVGSFIVFIVMIIKYC